METSTTPPSERTGSMFVIVVLQCTGVFHQLHKNNGIFRQLSWTAQDPPPPKKKRKPVQRRKLGSTQPHCAKENLRSANTAGHWEVRGYWCYSSHQSDEMLVTDMVMGCLLVGLQLIINIDLQSRAYTTEYKNCMYLFLELPFSSKTFYCTPRPNAPKWPSTTPKIW